MPPLWARIFSYSPMSLTDPGDDVRASRADLVGLGLEVGEDRGVLLLETHEPVGDLGAPGLQLHPLRQRLGLLHHLDLDVLELDLAPKSGRASCWSAARSFALP